MKRYFVLLSLAVGLSGLAAPPARAQTSGFVIGQGPGKLVDALIAAGFGNDNLRQALIDIASDVNPSVSDVITPAFLSTLGSCPANSTIFTNKLSSYAGSGVLINADCTASATGLQGSGFNGLPGTATRSEVIALVGPAALVLFSPAYALDATHNVFGILYAPQGSSKSFVLSNEAPGQLIGKLVTAGFGNYNLYQALVAIQQSTTPSVAPVLTDAFLGNLQSNCPPADQIFTIPLKNITGTVAVSDDCSVQNRNLTGSSFNGQPGTTTLVTNISGVGSANLVSSTSSSPLTSWTATGVTYNVFGILYTPGSVPPATVPALSVWGMFSLAGLLVGVAALQLQRRTRASTAQR